jgi:hypothetical protein
LNLFGFLGLLVAVAGAVVCGAWGFQQFGWIGLAAGVLIGLALGAIAGIALTALAFFIIIWPERMQQHRGLRRFFGRYWARDHSAAWQALATKLTVGDTVSGKVVASYYYGVFVDSGHGFPALLAVRYSMNGSAGPQPVVGDVVSASVRELDASERFIELTQVSPKSDSGEHPSNNGMQPTPASGRG